MTRTADSEGLRGAVDRAIADVLAQHMPALREEILRCVLDEVEALPRPADDTSTQLNAAVVTIQGRGTQAEILAALLDGVHCFSGRSALFVLRGGTAQGWQARGLLQDDGIKAIAPDVTAGVVARAVETRAAAAGTTADFDPHFYQAFGDPTEANLLLVPLVVREKVAALIYADRGTELGGQLDASAIELLVRTAGMWIELAGPRRAAAVAAEAHAPAKPAAAAAIAAAASPAMAPTPTVAAVEAAPVEAVAPAVSVRVEVSAPTVEPTPPVSAPPVPPMSAEEEEVHRKAKRFAKLLVEEIKLYNQTKVAEGRHKSDLYGLLRDDIEKSRASYDKRYGQSAAASAGYFTQELIRILAEGDVSLLGGSFSR